MKIPNVLEGFVKTLNNAGYMNAELDALTSNFVEYCSKIKETSTVLDIGSAYGFITFKALEQKVNVISNDIHQAHINIQKSIAPVKFKKNIKFIVGKFPTALKFPKESFDAIVIAQVLHFLEGKEIIEGINTLYKWLKKGGKVFISAASPYNGIYTKFIPEFEKRKSQSNPWPGMLKDKQKYISKRHEDLPKFINLLDTDILIPHLKNTGFYIEKNWLFTRHNLASDMRYDNKEILGVIARK